MRHLPLIVLSVFLASTALGQEQPKPADNFVVWPDLAPDETTRETGAALPPLNRTPPITRLANVRMPTLDVFPAKSPNGVGVLILPGGGFNFVVPDMEGSEAAAILNRHGVTAFVLRYRTKRGANDPGWKQALQDSQRAMKLLRADAKKWKLNPRKIGLLGFSAGGQVAARLLTDSGKLAYDAVDSVDKESHRPDFAVLVYPWNMYDEKRGELIPEIKVQNSLPPAFIVHTHDDRSSSLGSVLFYAELKKAGVSAELHVYENGGHGYGSRKRPNSNIGSWSNRMTDWLQGRRLATSP